MDIDSTSVADILNAFFELSYKNRERVLQKLGVNPADCVRLLGSPGLSLEQIACADQEASQSWRL